MFKPDEATYANGALVDLPYPTDAVRLMTRMAVETMDRIFRPGLRYSKVEVLLLNLCQHGEHTDDLFAESQPEKSQRLMGGWIRSTDAGERDVAYGQLAGGSRLWDAEEANEPERYDKA
jgi:hypothetical protein